MANVQKKKVNGPGLALMHPGRRFKDRQSKTQV